MRIRLMLAGFVAGCALSLAGTQALSLDEPAGGMKMPTPEEMQKMMQAWMDAMTPGEMHAKLQESVGTWDMTTKIWMAGPDLPPTESKGTSVRRSVLGGRFVLEENTGTFPMPDPVTGQIKDIPTQGMGLFGYDNYRKMFVGCWADSMGTQLLTMKGTMSPDGKTLTHYGEMDEPMLGVVGRYCKYVTHVIDADHQRFEIYDLHAGDHFKVVEIEYARKK